MMIPIFVTFHKVIPHPSFHRWKGWRMTTHYVELSVGYTSIDRPIFHHQEVGK